MQTTKDKKIFYGAGMFMGLYAAVFTPMPAFPWIVVFVVALHGFCNVKN